VPILNIGHGQSPVPNEISCSSVQYRMSVRPDRDGLILVYRANRINQLRAGAARFSASRGRTVPDGEAGMPYIFAIPIVVIGGALFGGATEILLVRDSRGLRA